METSKDKSARTEQLTKHYGTVAALEDLSLEVNAGEVLGYLGPNGAGKPNIGK
jgi:ABC-2 type transport system ATP-binding protein